ncbi:MULTISPECIES: hypothetical protein [Actinomyces]|uniref:Uncharacterized protein n=1 Tax=Actinomyces respiraculi TaxID=2744574 RepID=A0A7T0LIP1_9ACTO|nr:MULTISPECIES: hypothetical protein [Actinomyces]QPL04417.1 hypothetical protein ID810_06130 [Actinomyces respiraculi]
MTITTIKVDSTTRDRLRSYAARQGLTMDAALRQMTEVAEREQRLAQLRTEIEANPPDASYVAELKDWESDAWT